jgi:hypothetical protein
VRFTYDLAMTVTRRAQLVGLVVLAAVAAGCGGSKQATDITESTVEATDPSTTPTTLTARAQCALLVHQDASLRATEKDVAKKLKAARAIEPRSPESKSLAAQLTMLQRQLRDVDALLARVRAANDRATCPA